MSDKDIT